MHDAPFTLRPTEVYLSKLVQQNYKAASEEKNTDPDQRHGVPEVALKERSNKQ